MQPEFKLKHADIPEWVIVGESVLIRPYNSSGIISFVGTTHFQVSQSVIENKL